MGLVFSIGLSTIGKMMLIGGVCSGVIVGVVAGVAAGAAL